MYFVNYRLRKTWLDKCLRVIVLQDPVDKQHGKRTKTLSRSA